MFDIKPTEDDIRRSRRLLAILAIVFVVVAGLFIYGGAETTEISAPKPIDVGSPIPQWEPTPEAPKQQP
jgi:hypothetical protein